MSFVFKESLVEEAALAWFGRLEYEVLHGPDIAPEEPAAERTAFQEVILEGRLRGALERLNPDLGAEALDDAFRKITRPEGATLEARNRAFHRMLVDGVNVEYRRKDGSIAGAQVRILDFEDPARNDWVALNQFTVIEQKNHRRPDVVVFVNGLPLGIIELKNPTDENATIRSAYRQLQTYKMEIPSLFDFNELMIISDGMEARLGTLTAGEEWFKRWRTISGRAVEAPGLPELQVMIEGVFEKRRFLDLMENPTIVVLTDRNDLDNQLFGVFSRCRDLLRQPPVQAESRADLREKLRVEAGGVVFTTIQKFFPEEKGDRHPVLSERRNIVVIADEAHRSQYDFIDGFARHMRDALPKASFIGFTGTPIELTDKNTRAVFGDYISVYDIQRAVEDKATVPIYYESRLAKLELDEKERPRIDPDFEEVTEDQEIEKRERLKSKWARLEALVGAEKRLKQIARDIVDHFEQRLEAMDGKAMIVCMSRRICVELYEEIRRRRPAWHGEDDREGSMKVVMTGSASDPTAWQGHIRNKARRDELADRFRDARDPLKIAIVRDMWLTGFDAPSLHTMYLDKPMRAHGLMQAIARVNRVFRDKPGGLVVDYLGLAQELKQALATYTESGGSGETAIDQAEAVAVMLEKYEICTGLFHGFDWSAWGSGTPEARLALLPAGQEHVLAQEAGKERLLRTVQELSQAFALAVPHEEALRIRDDVGFFQAVRAVLIKERIDPKVKSREVVDEAIRQILSRAVISEGLVDIFAAAGLPKPDISILSDEFLAEVRGMPQKNLAVELLRKLLAGEVRKRRRKNVVEARSFAEMLEQSINRYRNRAIEAAQVIEELIEIARQIKEAHKRGEELGLTEEELAFYDALETNDSAVQVLGDETLRTIARELVKTVRGNVTIDWTVRESIRANLRRLVKRILRRHGYPPDKQEKATKTVLEQAELLSEEWAAA